MPNPGHQLEFRLKALFAAVSLAILGIGTTTASTAPASVNVDPKGHPVHDGPTSIENAAFLQSLHVGHDHAGHDHGDEEHWCGTDISSPEAQKLIGQFLADRAAGKYASAGKGGSDPDIGDRQIFNVFEDTWMELEFELVDKTGLYYLWVEVEELSNGNVTPTKIAQLQASIHDATPSRSINPAQGTFANIHDVFGLPPNVDGDGFVDLLMYDIGRGVGSVLGYVHPADLVLNPPAGVGNERDVLYLDSNEGTRNVSTLSVIAAHEYTHLVHQAYGSDQTFISEGLAEYAMVMNGFYWRGVGFVSSVTEVALPLFGWRDQSAVGARGYERGGLFFTYIGEQHGPEVVGQMLRDTQKKGALGMDSVLTMNGSSLGDVVLNYHTANRINDKSVDPRFGYNEPERSRHQALLSAPPVNGELPSTTSSEGGFTLEFEENVNPGSVYYLQITNVSDFGFVYDTPDPTGFFYAEKSQRNRARIVMQDTNGSLSFVDVDPSPDQVTLTGDYASLTFIIVHESPQIAVGDRNSLDAGWTPLSLATDVADSAVLPQAFGLESVYPNPFSGRASVSFELARSGPVEVQVIDMLGRMVVRFDHGFQAAGPHVIAIDGAELPAGSYVVRLVSDDQSDSRLVSLVR